jgi:hypothetical protein
MDQLQIQSLLEDILGSGNVYFQPPSSVQMAYPAIVYKRDLAETKFADNRPYRRTKRYSVTYISKTPNDLVPDKLADLPMSLFERFFTADNLNHDVYNIYF